MTTELDEIIMKADQAGVVLWEMMNDHDYMEQHARIMASVALDIVEAIKAKAEELHSKGALSNATLQPTEQSIQ